MVLVHFLFKSNAAIPDTLYRHPSSRACYAALANLASSPLPKVELRSGLQRSGGAHFFLIPQPQLTGKYLLFIDLREPVLFSDNHHLSFLI